MWIAEIVKYLFLCVLFTFLAKEGYSRDPIKGNVSDKLTGVSLSGVAIIGYSGNTVQGYTASDSNGNFVLKNDNDAVYTVLQFSYMGYKQLIYKLDGFREDLRIQMEEGDINIKPVVVKPQSVIKKNDTIIYNAASFTRKGDNTIAELINRLPDVSITVQGAIKVLGYNINRFYIENMDLLGGRYGIAINNIRPEDISAIEVYKNHQPVLALKEVEYSGQAAMNIILKDKARAKWLFSFGAAMGYGDSLLYNGTMSALRFSKKNQNIFLVKANNNGGNIIREIQMQSLASGAYRLEEFDGLENAFSISNRRLPIQDDCYYLNNSQIGSINTLHKLSKTAEIKANINFSINNLKNFNYSSQVYGIDNDSRFKITENSYGLAQTYHLIGEVTVKENSVEKYIENKLSFETDWDKYTRNVLNQEAFYGNKYNLPKVGLKNKFSVVKGRNGKPFKFESLLNFYNANQNLTITSDNPLQLFKHNEAEQQYSLLKFNSDHSFSFSRKLKDISLSYLPGLILNYEQLTSALTPTIKKENIKTENNINLLSVEPYIKGKFYYSVSNLKIDLTIPLSLRYDKYGEHHKFIFSYSPYLHLSYDLSDKFSLLSAVSASNRLSGVKEYADGYIFNDYRTASAKEEPSLPSYQRYYFSVKYQNILTGVGAIISVSHENFKNNVTLSDFFYENLLFNSQISGNNTDKNTSLGLDISYKLGLGILSVNAAGRYNMGSSSQLLQNDVCDYKTDGYDVQCSVSVAPVDWFYIDYKFNYNYSSLKNGSADRTIKSYVHQLEAVVTPVEKLNIRGSFDYYTQCSYQYNPSRLPFLNAYISYSYKKIKYFVNITNILNTREYVNSYFSGISSRYSITTLRGRETVVGISWNF